MVKNGNLTGFVEANGSVVEMSNTCCFDALLQVLTKAFIQRDNFRIALTEMNDHKLCAAVKILATKGANKALYKTRAETLMEILAPSGELVQTRSKRMRPPYLMYDCWGDFISLGTKLLDGIDSATYVCAKAQHVVHSSIITPNLEKLAQNGLHSLQNALDWSLQVSNSSLPCSCNDTKVVCGVHLFLDIDLFSSVDGNSSKEDFQLSALTVKLQDIPRSLSVSGSEASYLLNGVICRVSHNHVVALSRRLNGEWTLYDDLAKSPASACETSDVTPIALHYIKQ